MSKTERTNAFLKPILSFIMTQGLKASLKIIFTTLYFNITLNAYYKCILPLPCPILIRFIPNLVYFPLSFIYILPLPCFTRFIHQWPKFILSLNLSFSFLNAPLSLLSFSSASKLRCHLTKLVQSVNRVSSTGVRMEKEKLLKKL